LTDKCSSPIATYTSHLHYKDQIHC